jgi:putative hydrolase of the HAD superfamily
MPLRAITFDLWGTIIHDQDPPEKIAKRRAIILGALAEAGYPFELDEYRAGIRAANRIAKERIEREHVDIGPEQRWNLVTRELGIPVGHVPFERIAPAYVDVTVEFLPPLLPAVADALAQLHGQVKIGLICNTGFTGGDPLRRVLDLHGISRYFDVLTFSNEFGYLKPDPRIFKHTLEFLGVDPTESLHVGDIEDADVAGARAVGMYAARYAPEGEAETEGDLLVRDWGEFVAQLETLLSDA